MRSDQIQQKIEEFLPTVLDTRSAYCVDIRVNFDRRGALIQLFADTDAGITVTECGEISRELMSRLQEANVIEGSYRFEVSSPGVGQPLKLLRQFQKNIGRKFRIKYKRENEAIVVRGTLESVIDNRLVFREENGNPLEFIENEILDARVELPW